MARHSTLSTVIDSDVKKALVTFCKKKGLKIQHMVENAILEQLEDELDAEMYQQRKGEREIPLADVLKILGKK